ncbi:MAG: hypothetical protein ACYDBJ_19225 [Aggregatilineales bacterium]
MRYYLTPEPDAQSDEKIQDINRLYQTAQERVKQGEATVSTDEMTGVQALERKHPDLPMLCLESPSLFMGEGFRVGVLGRIAIY